MSKKFFPLWSRYVVMNTAAVLVLLWKGQFQSDRVSVFAIIFSFVLMNCIAWVSSRNYKEWK
jgi:hypothetical protein